MSARPARWKPFALCTLIVATALTFTLTSQVGAEVAQTSDTAGANYATAIAKAKEKRAAKLRNCNKKPTKAKRAACKKAANRAYQTAQDQAQEKRDAARNPDPSGEPPATDGLPSSPQDAYRDCLAEGGDPRECKDDAKGGEGAK
jgi:hypothetical protein